MNCNSRRCSHRRLEVIGPRKTADNIFIDYGHENSWRLFHWWLEVRTEKTADNNFVATADNVFIDRVKLELGKQLTTFSLFTFRIEKTADDGFITGWRLGVTKRLTMLSLMVGGYNWENSWQYFHCQGEGRGGQAAAGSEREACWGVSPSLFGRYNLIR